MWSYLFSNIDFDLKLAKKNNVKNVNSFRNDKSFMLKLLKVYYSVYHVSLTTNVFGKNNDHNIMIFKTIPLSIT